MVGGGVAQSTLLVHFKPGEATFDAHIQCLNAAALDPSLRTLEIHVVEDVVLSEAIVRAIASVLQNRSLSSITLHPSIIANKPELFTGCFQDLPNLKTLRLAFSAIDRPTTTLPDAILLNIVGIIARENSTLKILNLSGNAISLAIAQALANAIQSNTSLSLVWLVACRLSATSLLALLSGFGKNLSPTPTKHFNVDLTCNDPAISDDTTGLEQNAGISVIAINKQGVHWTKPCRGLNCVKDSWLPYIPLPEPEPEPASLKKRPCPGQP